MPSSLGNIHFAENANLGQFHQVLDTLLRDVPVVLVMGFTIFSSPPTDRKHGKGTKKTGTMQGGIKRLKVSVGKKAELCLPCHTW